MELRNAGENDVDFAVLLPGSPSRCGGANLTRLRLLAVAAAAPSPSPPFAVARWPLLPAAAPLSLVTVAVAILRQCSTICIQVVPVLGGVSTKTSVGRGVKATAASTDVAENDACRCCARLAINAGVWVFISLEGGEGGRGREGWRDGGTAEARLAPTIAKKGLDTEF